jgi:hypothetical protein
MLHITNGDSAANGIRGTGLPGEALSWADVLHEGPVPENLTLDQLRTVRARFIASCGWNTFELALNQFSRRDRVLLESLNQDEIVLWFEHDLYDQLQVIQLLDWFGQQKVVRTKLSLVCGGEYLGPATVERLRERFPQRQPVTGTQLELARAAWAAFRSPEPGHLTTFLQRDTTALPFLATALLRHLQQYPSKRNGLSRSESQALEAVGGGVVALGEVYRDSHHNREEAIFLGDTVFGFYIERLSSQREPLVLRDDGQVIKAPRNHADSTEFWSSKVTLTELGRAVLDGRADQVRVNGIDRWLGGVHLSGMETRYRWDEAARQLDS